MALHEFLQQLMQRTGAEAVNVRALTGGDTCDIHLFFAELVLSYQVDSAEWDNPQSLIDGICQHVDSTRPGAS